MSEPMDAEDFYGSTPRDLNAEQAVLGAMLTSAAAAERCRQALSADDFYRPAHQIVFTAILADMSEGITPDPVTVNDRLTSESRVSLIGGAPYLHTLMTAVPVIANAPHYARRVRERAILRRLREAGHRILQWSDPDSDTDPHGLTERALRELESVRDSGLGDDLTVRTIAEFLDVEESDDYDWVIPGLLERGDRFMLTGVEGCGKSELFRMFAVCAAAGVHPLTFKPMPPMRVMLIDCENSDRHTRRKIRPLTSQARLQGYPVTSTNLWLECRPQGMDLALDKDVSWLLRQVAAVGPDITFLGPLYRLAPRALNDDSDAAPVIAILNMIRARGSAVVLEAHAGHSLGPGGLRDLRPRGSSAFLGWPEFGYGLRWADESTKERRVVEFVSWRGDRDEREWPSMLAAGGIWPWRPYEKQPAREDSWNDR